MAERRLEDSVAEHRKKSELSVGVAVITLSTSRSLETDKSAAESTRHHISGSLQMPMFQAFSHIWSGLWGRQPVQHPRLHNLHLMQHTQ